MYRTFFSVSIAVVLLSGDVALAQQDYNLGYPDLGESDVATIPVPPIHIQNPSPPAYWGWAGVMVGVHVLDNSEVDVDGVATYFPSEQTTIDPLGPRSNNLQSSVRYFKLLDPQHAQSGINVFQSQIVPVPSGYSSSTAPNIADIQVHVKGTNVGQNNDTDLAINVYNIWHIRTGPLYFPLQNSDLVWGPYGVPPQQNPSGYFFPVSAGPIANSTGPTGGQWWHLQGPNTIPFLLYASDYFATLVDTITVGIEHVPEPAGAVLIAAGIACALAGRRFRKRRKTVTA